MVRASKCPGTDEALYTRSWLTCLRDSTGYERLPEVSWIVTCGSRVIRHDRGSPRR